MKCAGIARTIVIRVPFNSDPFSAIIAKHGFALGKIRVPFKTDTDYPVTLACSVNRCFFNAAGTDKLTP